MTGIVTATLLGSYLLLYALTESYTGPDEAAGEAAMGAFCLVGAGFPILFGVMFLMGIIALEARRRREMAGADPK